MRKDGNHFMYLRWRILLVFIALAVALMFTLGTLHAEQPATTPKAAAAKKEKKAAPKLAPGQQVNLNTASQENLEKLPGIGAKKAQAIIKGRPYKSPKDIMKVKGIKGGIYKKIKDFITVK